MLVGLRIALVLLAATCLEFAGARALRAIDAGASHLATIAAGNLVMGAGIALLLLWATRHGYQLGLRPGNARRAALLTLPIAGINLIAWLSPAGNGAELHPLRTIALYAVVALAIGFGEELVYRGAIMAAFDVERHPLLAIVGSALVFGWFHVIDGLHVATDAATLVNALQATLLVGVPFALVRIRTGSLAGLVIGHAAYDFAALLDSGEPGAAPSAMALTTSTFTAAVAFALYVWWYVEGRSPRPHMASTQADADAA